MAKGSTNGQDPAFSFFPNDWMGGTMTLSRHQKGAYLDLLVAQFNNGHLSIEEVKNVLGNDFAIWGVLSKKFATDSEGRFYNVRLENEILKRKEYNKSRRQNADSNASLSEHMGIGNGIVKDIEERKRLFAEKVNGFLDYADSMRKDFIAYWTEHSAHGRKMRFEKETVFDISRRLTTWANNSKEFVKNQKAEFPDLFDKKLYYELQSNDQAKFYRYQAHLRSLGFAPQYNTTDSPLKGSLTGWFKSQAA